MENTSTLGVLFYIKKAKENKDGNAPIYLRITVNGQRAEMALKRFVDPDKWNIFSGNVKGKTEDIKGLKVFIDRYRNKAYKAYQDMINNDEVVSAESLKNKILGIDPHKMTLLEAFEHHNTLLNERVNIDYAPGTIQRYKITYEHIQTFIKKYYKTDDVFLKSLDHQFITKLERYFKIDKSCNHNTTMKYIMNMRKVILMAINNDWLEKDPFRKFKIKLEEVDRGFLSKEELVTLEQKKFAISRLDTIRDIFVFACYTGFAYADVEKLTEDNIAIGIDGEKWLFAKRKKTNTSSNVFLLPKALEIIEKYKDHPEANNKGKLLPVISNQKINAYLKEIADLCEIKKHLTFHLARHTFATTVTLTNGVPIESVSRMLGHKNIKTTQIYAKIVERKVSNDMLKLRDILSHVADNTDSTKQTK
jgi:site-specific recombinase XerD